MVKPHAGVPFCAALPFHVPMPMQAGAVTRCLVLNATGPDVRAVNSGYVDMACDFGGTSEGSPPLFATNLSKNDLQTIAQALLRGSATVSGFTRTLQTVPPEPDSIALAAPGGIFRDARTFPDRGRNIGE